MAVTALIAALLFCIPLFGPGTAIVLGILVLTQKRPGRGMAIAAIVLGTIGLIGQFIGFATLVERAGDSIAREDQRRDEGYETISALEAEPGDCLTGVDLGESSDDVTEVHAVQRVPCDTEHEWEVFAADELPGGKYPGQAQLFADADEFCATEFKEFVGRGVARSEFEMYTLFPQKRSWELYEDYGISCLVGLGGGQTTDGSLRDTNR
jgi:Septum formation